jgi:signal transduction histidine kinase
MGERMRSFDWTTTSLGPPTQWPQSLRTVLDIMLRSQSAIFLWWGPELVQFYNDAYRPILGSTKHPAALGNRGRDTWAEIWDIIAPMIDAVMQRGESTNVRDGLLVLERNGFPEEGYFDYAYSPIRDESGRIAGVFAACNETTGRVLGERRLDTLRALGAASRDARSADEACSTAAHVMAANVKDIPFALLYLSDDAGGSRLAAATGIDAASPAARPDVWPIAEALSASTAGGASIAPLVLDDRARHLPEVPGTTWPEACRSAAVLALTRPGQAAGKGAAGALVLGISPRLLYDDAYRTFQGLVAGQVAASAASAEAAADARQRAAALAELDRAKTAFFSNVSHEFRTPLTLILGSLADALRAAGPIPSDIHDLLDVAHRNSLRLLKLVNTLLEFSRIEAGRVHARFEPVDLGALTTDLASTFRSAMQKAALDFRVECDPLPEPAYVDRDMWEQIVLNLVSNAFKFTLSGGVVVSVRARGRLAELTVRDTGGGIPESELPRVFERFHRVEGTRGRTYEGSGIGLALVYELVKLHGGDISVESQVGQGTTFTVSFPMGAAHLPPEHVESPRIGASTHAGVSAYAEEALRWLSPAQISDEAHVREDAKEDPHRACILLVDDNADMREYGRRLLAERWRVEAVGNGLEALRAARQRRPDVIVTDVMMPELDGFGLLRELRADPELRSTPVIMLSARAGEEARIEGIAATADDYLVKPFSARELIAHVEAQLLKSRIRAVEREHAQRLANLFAHAPVAIAVLRGPEHIYELANPPYQKLVSRRPVVGKAIREALPELEGQGIYELLDRVRASGEPYVGRSVGVSLNRGDGGTAQDCYFDFVYQPVFDDQGAVDSIVVVASDVTALAVARAEAEGANRLKDEFLATLSHELRTPLNAVLGYTQMLRAGVIRQEARASALETIERNAFAQKQLIDDVLDVSRIITGKLRFDMQPVDLAHVITDALESVAPAANAKGVLVRPIINLAGVSVAGDAQRLQQVVWNLLSNAIKFTPRGGQVEIRLQRVASQVELAVSDTGEGIVAAFLPHLFERFKQADSTLTRAHGGLGLGLAISKYLVEAHGGTIQATSAGAGQGTIVRIELPLLIVHEDRVVAPGRVHPASGATATLDLRLADLSGIRVLLVDNDTDALQMAKDALNAAGAHVATAAGARQALDVLDAERFDVAVLDVGMPDVDGYELLRRIRERPPSRNGTLPVAALTAYDRAADRSRSLQAGFQIHLGKPVQPTDLAAAVRSLASGSRRPR